MFLRFLLIGAIVGSSACAYSRPDPQGLGLTADEAEALVSMPPSHYIPTYDLEELRTLEKAYRWKAESVKSGRMLAQGTILTCLGAVISFSSLSENEDQEDLKLVAVGTSTGLLGALVLSMGTQAGSDADRYRTYGEIVAARIAGLETLGTGS